MIKFNADVDLMKKAEEISMIERNAAPLSRKTQKLGTFMK
jgi:hypothetical protein